MSNIWVTVLTHNRQPQLEQLITHPAFLGDIQQEGANFLILDQGSDDGTDNFLRRWWLNHQNEMVGNKIWHSSQNVGIVRGHQRQVDWLLGRGLLSDDIVVFLDDDVHPIRSGWLRSLVEPLLFPRVAVAGAYGATIKEGWEGYNPPPTKPGLVDVVSQSHMAVNAQLLLTGFEFPYELGACWHEDAFLCLWAIEQGYKVWYTGTPESVGLYHERKHKEPDALYNKNWELVRARFAGGGWVTWEKRLLWPTR